MAGQRFDVDAPTDGGDVAPYHVHADAAPGQVGDHLGGGKAGHEDQLPDLAVGHVIADGHALLAGLGEDLVAGQAFAVVIDLDHDAAALVVGGQAYGAVLGLAGGEALGRHLDAVVDTVADDVGERVGEFLDHALVQLGVLALEDQLDLLAQLAGGVAHHAGEAVEDEADRQHADRHHRFLQLAGVVFQLAEGLVDLFEDRRVEAGGELGEHGLGDHQFADLIDQAVDLFHADADRAGFTVAGGTRRCRRAASGAPIGAAAVATATVLCGGVAVADRCCDCRDDRAAGRLGVDAVAGSLHGHFGKLDGSARLFVEEAEGVFCGAGGRYIKQTVGFVWRGRAECLRSARLIIEEAERVVA